MKIKSITTKCGLPTVKFSESVTEDSNLDGSYPSADSGDILPASSFVDAIEGLVEGLKSLGFSDHDWGLKKLDFLWDKEGSEYNYRATLTVFDQEYSDKLSFVRESTSIDEISLDVAKRLERVHSEAERFVSGKSAQLNLLANDDENIQEEAA